MKYIAMREQGASRFGDKPKEESHMKINWEILECALNVAVAALAPLAMVAWIIGRI
jgi:hypothetical protein